MTFWTVWILTALGFFNWSDCRVSGSVEIGGYRTPTYSCGTPAPSMRSRR